MAPRLAPAALHLFGLAGFAVAQPLFDVLGQHSAFFVAHRARPLDLVGLALAVSLFPPALAFATVAVARIAGARASWIVLLVAIGFGGALTALPPLAHGAGLAAPLAAGLALTSGCALALVYARFAAFRSFATLLAAAPLIFASLFLLTGPVGRLVQGPPNFEAFAAGASSDAPVVIVVLDELGTTSLQNAAGGIDAARFPTFAMLAREATWYRNARTVHTSTIQSVPAILSGVLPEAGRKGRLPWAADHPDNLFRLLAGSWSMHVVESETLLWNDPEAEREPGRFSALLRDASRVGAHVLLPETWAGALPSIRETWGRFDRPGIEGFSAAARERIWVDYQDRLGRFRNFVAQLGTCDGRCFHFLHVLLPHRPWQLLPSTRRYAPATTRGFASDEVWGADSWHVDQAYQRHLLQTMATDRLLGELVERMREVGMWDEALFVLVADHGVSFWKGESMRWLEPGEHPEDIARVPLFVKLPGQQRGAISDRLALTVDVVPTVAKALGIELPWRADGCALDQPICSATARRNRITDRYHNEHSLPADLLDRPATLARKLALFGEGGEGLFALGPFPELLGRQAAELASATPSEWVARFDREGFEAAAADGTFALARIEAFLRPHSGPGATQASGGAPATAIVVDGIIAAVAAARPHAAGSLLVSAMIPERSTSAGAHEIALYTVSAASSKRGQTGEIELRLAGKRSVTLPTAAPERSR